MPVAAMVNQSNQWLSAESTVKLVKERPDIVEILGVRGKLADAAEKLLNVDAAGIKYLKAMPGPVQEAIRSAIFDAITGRTGQRAKPVQLSYLPALEFGASVTDFGQAVSIQVRGPYDAVSPGARFAAARLTQGGTTARRAKPARRKVTRAKRKPARRPGR